MQCHMTTQANLLMKVFVMSNPSRMSLSVFKHVGHIACHIVPKIYVMCLQAVMFV